MYLELFSGLEGRPEIANELSLFNRAGDLYLRASKVPEAVEMYERAATLYADHGFPNNAIALCNKVLRNAPGRTHIYLTLAQLMVERGFVAEAKQNLLEYADRMQKAGKTDEAFRALKEFADLSPENEEIRLLLAEQLKAAARTAEAREQLAKLFHEAEASGDQRRSRATLAQIRAIDPDFDPSDAPKVKVKERKEKSSDLVFLDLDAEYRTDTAIEEAEGTADEVAPAPPQAPSSDLEAGPETLTIEPTVLESAETAAADADVGLEGLEGLEVARDFEEQAADVPSIEFEPTSLVEEAEEPAEDVRAEGVEPAEAIERFSADDLDFQVTPELTDTLEIPEVEAIPADDPLGAIEVPDLDLDGFDAAAGVEGSKETARADAVEPLDEIEDFPQEDVAVAEPELPLLDEVDDRAPAAVDLATLESAVADDPDHPGHHVALGEALLERGERERGLQELDIALTLHEGREEWSRAGTLVDEILRLDNNSVRHHQKRVEHAYRTGDKRHLVEAYVGLGDVLVRSEAMERAKLVYKRVLEHEPNNQSALAALGSLEPESPTAAAAEPAGADFVDLGALIFEDEPQRDTRMRVQDEEPTGDEERDFQELLAQFKRGIEANIEEDDWQAHYDLGVAFKEMGLLDEAIAEFQKALRSPAGRLRTAEALGGCFFEKHQFSVAATVMRRAVETDVAGDEAKIGLLYWLGRCDEEMGKKELALGHFQRVFALDIRFADVADRVKRLAGSVS
ncbi:MAG: tetratricopeptide repeat protein [Myxococcales bacterium]|nr:tetratricopeptide repeat protein [Myxococcales bacterium]